jgi:hypothetical protein
MPAVSPITFSALSSFTSLTPSQIPQPPPLTGVVVGKWHTTFETGLAVCSAIVLLFALFILYVVTHTNASHLSELKATIKAQQKELRKLRKKTAERAMLVQNGNGDLKAVNGYGAVDDKKRRERLAKIVPYRIVPGEMGVGN